MCALTLPYLQQCNLIFLRNFRKCWQTLSELNNQLYCKNGDFGDVTKMDIVLIFVFIRRRLLQREEKWKKKVSFDRLSSLDSMGLLIRSLTIIIRFKSSSDGCS